MKRKLITIAILCMFLLTGLITGSATGISASVENTENEQDTLRYGSLTVSVHHAGSFGYSLIPDVKITCEGIGLLTKDYYRVNYTSAWMDLFYYPAEFGVAEDDKLPVPGLYRITGEKEGYKTNSQLIYIKAAASTSLALFKTRNRMVNNNCLSYLFEKFPLLQILLNL